MSESKSTWRCALIKKYLDRKMPLSEMYKRVKVMQGKTDEEKQLIARRLLDEAIAEELQIEQRHEVQNSPTESMAGAPAELNVDCMTNEQIHEKLQTGIADATEVSDELDLNK